MKENLIFNHAKLSKATFILAHGAGAPMDSDWMNQITEYIIGHDISVIRFEFPYMQERRVYNKKRPPNTKKVLIQHWQDILKTVNDKPLFIGGKSMGGRIAGLIADTSFVSGLICLGFPFHAPKKPFAERLDLLQAIKTPTLVLQGERDTMGFKAELSPIKWSKNIQIQFLPDGDHSFKPRKSSGLDLNDNLKTAAQFISDFISQSGPAQADPR